MPIFGEKNPKSLKKVPNYSVIIKEFRSEGEQTTVDLEGWRHDMRDKQD
jgi:hypothetical protein